VKSIKEYADYITNLKRVGTGLGEYIFDKEELQD
jgi:ferritin heavy chain